MISIIEKNPEVLDYCFEFDIMLTTQMATSLIDINYKNIRYYLNVKYIGFLKENPNILLRAIVLLTS